MLNFLSSVKNPNQPNIQRGIAYLPIFSSLVGSISIFTKTCCQLRYSGSLAVGDFQSWTKSTNSLHVVPWIIPILVVNAHYTSTCAQRALQYSCFAYLVYAFICTHALRGSVHTHRASTPPHFLFLSCTLNI